MQSGLQVLDRAVHAAVAVELGERTDPEELKELGISSLRGRSIAGFTIVRNASRDAEVDQSSADFADTLMRFCADEMLVRKKLKMQSVEPIAVLPATAWGTLCDRTKLFRFVPKENLVRIDDGIMHEAVVKVRDEEELLTEAAYSKLFKRLMLIAVACALPVIARFFFDWPPYGYWSIVAFIANLCVWANSCEKVSRGTHLLPRKGRVHEMIKTLVERYTADGTLYERLWPKFKEPVEDGRGRDLTIGIVLPTPPEDVVETLIRAERTRLPLQVAAVGEAIRLRHDVVSIFAEAGARQIEAELLAATHDPIIYVREGSAIAIVAQFGDFPIEQEVIREVVNSFALA